MRNGNHPAKGSSIKVEPIKNVRDINTIKKLLSGNTRNYALFVIGINTSLRASDLTRIKASDVVHLKAGDTLYLKEKKVGKNRMITWNPACVKATARLLVDGDYKPDEPLFKSQKGSKPLTVQSVHRLVKSWCRMVNLKGNFGSHTLRKTWGYHKRVTFGRGWPEISQAFGHSTQNQTLEYLCIQPEEIKSLYMDEL